MKLQSLFLISSVASASGMTQLPIVSLASPRQAKQGNTLDSTASVLDIPRGGANIGPLEPETLVKAFCGLALTQGLLMNTGPRKSNELYGLGGKNNDAQAQFQAELFGVQIINVAVMVYLLLVKGCSLAKVNQVGYAISAYQNLRFWLGGTAAEVGSVWGVKLGLAICVGAFWAMSQDFSDTAIKVLAVFWLLSGAQMIVDPEGVMKSWKNEGGKLNPVSSFILGQNGWGLLALTAINLSILVKGASPLQAAGYNAVVWALNHAYNLVTGNYKALSMPEGPMVVWCLLHSLIAYATLA